MAIETPLVTIEEIKLNANHLKRVDDATLQSVIDDVHVMYIEQYYSRWQNDAFRVRKLKVIEKLLSQHLATLNVRRPDSESVQGLGSKSLSVPKDMDLDQTEYGQMAKRLAKKLGLDWASDDDSPACIRIY